jgi:hypothetical protein
MDPDLVRQQAEEEAASRILSRREPPPDVRIEPILPMPAHMMASRPHQPKPTMAVYQGGLEAATAIASTGWRLAFGIAASCVLGTTVGLVGGMMAGVKMQLVPWQGALIGASAGLLLGWRLGSLALIKRRALGRMQAYGAAFRAAFMIFLIMAAAMFVAPHFTGAAKGANQPLDASLFWRAVGGGALFALLFGAAIIRRAFADAELNSFDGGRR